MKKTSTVLAGALLACTALAAPAFAATTYYATTFQDINNLGASGSALVTYNSDNQTLKVSYNATGLAKNMTHLAHIHGTFDSNGNPTQAVTPSLANNDTDGNGVLSLAEGAAVYGPIILNLTHSTQAGLNGFPKAANGSINFTQTYNLTNTDAFGSGYDASDLMPLNFREIVVHGAYQTSAGLSLTGKPGDYSLTVPVLAGVLKQVAAPVPLPATGLLLLGGLAGLGAFGSWRKRQKQSA